VISKSFDIKRMVMVRINPGEDVLEALKESVGKENIKNAVIVEGIGSSSAYHYHVVSDLNLPPAEIYTKAEAPADVVSISGLIIDGKIHAHVVFANDKVCYGGHLERGVKTLTFCIVGILITNDISYKEWDNFQIL